MTRNLTWRTLVGGLLVCGAVASGCGGADEPSASPSAASDAPTVEAGSSNDAFWAALFVEGNEVVDYSTLDEMAANSDRVVIGKIAEVRPGEPIQGDAKEDVLEFVEFVIQTTEDVAGKGGGELIVEFVLPGSGGEAKDLDALRPSGEVLLFLHEKTDRPGQFRTTTSSGLWIESAEGLSAPLSSRSDGGKHYDAEIKNMQTLEELAAYLKSVQ